MISPIAVFIIVFWTAAAENVTFSRVSNKTKRTLSQHLINYENYESRPMPVYTETSFPYALSGNDYRSLKSEYKPAFPMGSPQELKLLHSQQSPQQILYEVPSVIPSSRVHQILQPVINRDQTENYKEQTLSTGSNGQNYVQTETMVLPIDNKYRDVVVHQHVNYPSANARYNILPLRKQLQGNEKTNYEIYNVPHSIPNPSHSGSNHFPYVNQFVYQPQVNKVPLFPNQLTPRIPNTQNVPTVNYINRNIHSPRRLNFNIPKYNPPTINNINISPTRKPNGYSTLKTPPNRDENVEQRDGNEESREKPTQKVDENDSEEKSDHEDDEHEDNSEKQADEFEENDHFDYSNDKDVTEEEYDQDGKRGSNTYISSKKYPKKQSKNEKLNGNNYYKFKDSNYNREHSEHKPLKKGNKIPKMIYKSIKFSKEIKEPDNDSIEGKQSENIPVTRKHRLIREKWYISKNGDDTGKE